MALLNNADAIYFGDRPVDRVYLGTRQVWPWTPELLFQNGEQGGYWDFTNPHGLFQDAAGTSPVVAFGDPIGMAADLSGNGNHLLQTTVPDRPTYTVDGALHDGVDDFLFSGNPADWIFLHDGSGGYMAASTIYSDVVGSDSAGYFGTQGAGSNTVGLRVGNQSRALSRSLASVGNGSASVTPSHSGTGSIVQESIVTEAVDHSGERITATLNGVEYGSADYAAFTPSPSIPTNPFRTHIITGLVLTRRRMLAINRPLTAPERNAVRAWLMEGVE